jgi:hypothetical protein
MPRRRRANILQLAVNLFSEKSIENRHERQGPRVTTKAEVFACHDADGDSAKNILQQRDSGQSRPSMDNKKGICIGCQFRHYLRKKRNDWLSMTN